MDKNTCRKNFYNILSLYIFFVNQFGRHYNVKPCLLQTDKSRNGMHCNFRAGKDNSFYWPLSKLKHILKSIILLHLKQSCRYASVVCGLFCLQLLYSLSFRSIVKYKQVHHLGLPVLLPIFITSFVTVCSFFKSPHSYILLWKII